MALRFVPCSQCEVSSVYSSQKIIYLHQPNIIAVINKCLESSCELLFSFDRHFTSLICSCLFDVSSFSHPGPVRFGSWLTIQVEMALLSTWSFFWGFPGF